MRCDDVESCRVLARRVVGAIGAGGLLEDQLAVFTRRDRFPSGSATRPAPFSGQTILRFASIEKRIADRRRRVVSISRGLKAARSAADFSDLIGALPDAVDIQSVGWVAVVTDETRSLSPTWADRIRCPGEFWALDGEVRAALGDLVRVRTRLDLGMMRLSQGG